MTEQELARRERQILEILYRLGEATANEVCEGLEAGLANPTVRTQLRVMEQKGLVGHRVEGRCFIYFPTVPKPKAAGSALQSVLKTFFQGSVEKALAAHFADPQAKLDAEELRRLRELIDRYQPPQE